VSWGTPQTPPSAARSAASAPEARQPWWARAGDEGARQQRPIATHTSATAAAAAGHGLDSFIIEAHYDLPPPATAAAAAARARTAAASRARSASLPVVVSGPSLGVGPYITDAWTDADIPVESAVVDLKRQRAADAEAEPEDPIFTGDGGMLSGMLLRPFVYALVSAAASAGSAAASAAVSAGSAAASAAGALASASSRRLGLTGGGGSGGVAAPPPNPPSPSPPASPPPADGTLPRAGRRASGGGGSSPSSTALSLPPGELVSIYALEREERERRIAAEQEERERLAADEELRQAMAVIAAEAT